MYDSLPIGNEGSKRNAFDTYDSIGKFLLDRKVLHQNVWTSSVKKGATPPSALKSQFGLYLPAGFAKSMQRSGKNSFLLCPLPSNVVSTTTIFGSDPGERVNRATEFLATHGYLEHLEMTNPTIEKQMLIGFSQGGISMWYLLRKMGDSIDFVLSLDTNDFLTHRALWEKWLHGSSHRQMIATTGQNTSWHKNGKGALESFVQSKGFRSLRGRLHLVPNEHQRHSFFDTNDQQPTPFLSQVWADVVLDSQRNLEAHPDSMKYKFLPYLLNEKANGREPNKTRKLRSDSGAQDYAEAHHAFAYFGSPFIHYRELPRRFGVIDTSIGLDQNEVTNFSKVTKLDYYTYLDWAFDLMAKPPPLDREFPAHV
jgi:hypothetical protein